MIHVVIFLEGMNLSTQPGTLTPRFEQMWAAMVSRNDRLGSIRFKRGQTDALRTDDLMIIQWGHPLTEGEENLRSDQKLMAAENTILSRLSYHRIKENEGEHTWRPRLLTDFLESPIKSGVNLAIEIIKDQVFMLGLTDVVYYTSKEGEREVRKLAYSSAMQKLNQYQDAAGDFPPIALHLITHSQGATIGFDFLFGLFAPDDQWPEGKPNFATDPGVTQELRDQYLAWRERAQQGQLTLGSFSTFGSQIALMTTRKQKLVDILAAGGYIDPGVIGVKSEAGRVLWKNFYDRNDVLGYPLRPLFQPDGAMAEFEVDSSLNPMAAHSNYFENNQVQQEIADMIASAF